jgi:hypothetical protein
VVQRLLDRPGQYADGSGPNVTDVKGRLARQVVNRARQKRVAGGRGKGCAASSTYRCWVVPWGPDGERWSAYDVVGTKAGANVTFDVSADLATITHNTKR